jgi:broad specificity phosphatase PhoE
MIIYLIRHGQTTSDVEDRYGDKHDDNLTQLGKEQAKQLGLKLKDKGIKKIYSSPKTRACNTALIINEELKIPFEIVDELKERDRYGILSGMKKEEAAKKYPDQVALLPDAHSTIKEGEPYEPFKMRIENTLRLMFNKSQEEGLIAVVSHGGPIRLIYRELLNKGEVDVEDCGYVKLELLNGRYIELESEGIVPK